MTVYYNDSRYNGSNGASDGTRSRPFTSPSQWPTPYTFHLAGGPHKWGFANGAAWNLTQPLYAINNGTKITIFAYGDTSLPKPKLSAFRMAKADEFTEIDPAQWPASIVAMRGSNVWLIADQAFGLFGDGTWGVRRDTQNVTGGGAQPLVSEKQWNCITTGPCTISSAGTVIYSAGNPATKYGVFVNGIPKATWDTKPALVYIVQVFGGFEMSGIRFEACIQPFVPSPTYGLTVAQGKLKDVWAHHNDVVNCYRGFDMQGGGNDGISGFKNLLIYQNNFKNLGAGAILTVTGVAFQSSRIYRNVIAGACLAYSDGAIYISANDSYDGSKLIIEENSISNVGYGNYWPTDGWALYAEQNSKSVVFRRNVVWGCKRGPIKINNVKAGVEFYENIGFASSPADIAGAISQGSGFGLGNTRIERNYLFGYSRFLDIFLHATGTSTCLFQVIGNTAIGSGAFSDDTGQPDALHVNANTTLTQIVLDSNQLVGFRYEAFDWESGVDRSQAWVTNLRGRPSSNDAGLVVPTDGSVNYAIQ